MRVNSVWLWLCRFRRMFLTALSAYDCHWHYSFSSVSHGRWTVVWPLHQHCRWLHWMMIDVSLSDDPLSLANWNIDWETNRNTANRCSWCHAAICVASCTCRWIGSNRWAVRWIWASNRWTNCSCRLLQQFLQNERQNQSIENYWPTEEWDWNYHLPFPVSNKCEFHVHCPGTRSIRDLWSNIFGTWFVRRPHYIPTNCPTNSSPRMLLTQRNGKMFEYIDSAHRREFDSNLQSHDGNSHAIDS